MSHPVSLIDEATNITSVRQNFSKSCQTCPVSETKKTRWNRKPLSHIRGRVYRHSSKGLNAYQVEALQKAARSLCCTRLIRSTRSLGYLWWVNAPAELSGGGGGGRVQRNKMDLSFPHSLPSQISLPSASPPVPWPMFDSPQSPSFQPTGEYLSSSPGLRSQHVLIAVGDNGDIFKRFSSAAHRWKCNLWLIRLQLSRKFNQTNRITHSAKKINIPGQTVKKNLWKTEKKKKIENWREKTLYAMVMGAFGIIL